VGAHDRHHHLADGLRGAYPGTTDSLIDRRTSSRLRTRELSLQTRGIAL
jgi:hypothetical protein